MAMNLNQAMDDLLVAHRERIELLLRRKVTKRGWFGDQNLFELSLQWGSMGQFTRFVMEGDCDEILFLRTILMSEGAFFECYIPVRHIDFDKEVFTDEQLCRKKPPSATD